MKIKRKVSILALNISMLLGVSHTAVAGGENYQKLEDRIAQLEQMVVELKKELNSQKQEQPKAITQIAETKSAPQSSQQVAKHSYSFGGFVKTTGNFSSYSDGDLSPASAGRDFYIPGTIPVGGDNESTDFDFGAKESRINFKSNHELANGDKISTFIELDFLLGPGGNERVSNSYNLRMRHAFFKYNNWLFGETWSTFQNVKALPESVDFLAASDGTIFGRQPMIRYTNGNWQFALENPETTITPFGGGARIVSDDNSYPDLVARYNYNSDWGHLTVAGLLRSLEYDQVGNNESETSYGISFSGKLNVGKKDDLRFMLSTGSGMGRYIALNTANGAVLTSNGSLDAIDSTAGFISYRHFWSDKVRSNITYSQIDIDNDTDLTGFSVTRSARSLQANVLFSPVDKVTLGVGYLFAERELESREDGELNRLILSAKYDF